MVPRLEMATTLRKLDTNVTLVTVVSALAVLLKQLNLKALKAPDDGVTSIAQMATMGFDGVDGGFDGVGDGFDGFDGDGDFDGMEGDSDGLDGFGGTNGDDGFGFAGLMASMVWVTDLNRRKLRYEMLKFSPWKTWICSSKKQAWDVEGCRSSRRFDVANLKKELMGSQNWSVGVTWAMMASMASMVASMASMASTEMRAASVAELQGFG